MPEIVHDCPRCGAKKITFDMLESIQAPTGVWEVFSVCRSCGGATIFKSSKERSPMQYDRPSRHLISGYVRTLGGNVRPVPEHVPRPIAEAFTEGATCLAIGCHNAAAAMFRLTLELSTKDAVDKLTRAEKEDLGKRNDWLASRLDWLFEKGILSKALKSLSSVVRNDGNDGAHDGTLDQETAEDLIAFTERILVQTYTEPAKVRIAVERSAARANQGS